MSRLSKAIGAPGGQSFAEAMAQAQRALDDLSAEAGDHLAASVERAQELARMSLGPEGAAAAGPLLETALEIQAVAGTFGKPDLSEAAKLLAEFLAETTDTAKWSPRAVLIFTDALNSIHRGGDGSPRELVTTLQVFSSRVLAGAAKL